MSLAEVQRAAWVEMRAEIIPHGANFPFRLVCSYLGGRGIILDVGCGPGKNVDLEEQGFGVLGLDINEAAVSKARSGGMPALVADLTRLGAPGALFSCLTLIELADAALLEGLLCNLVDDQPRRAMRVINYYLAPGGYVFVADILQPTEGLDFLRRHLPAATTQALVQTWEARYAANEAIGLPHGVFEVAKPGPAREQEWGTPADLQALRNSPEFERFARHWTIEDLRALAAGVGLEERYFSYTFFRSRGGKPLLGGLFVWQKADRFCYHPWYKGMTHPERAAASDLRARLGCWKTGDPNGYYQEWVERLKANLPDWPEIFPGLNDLNF